MMQRGFDGINRRCKAISLLGHHRSTRRTTPVVAWDGDLARDLHRMPEAVVFKTPVVALDGDLTLDLHRMPEAVVLKTPVVALDGVMDRDPGIFQQASGG